MITQDEQKTRDNEAMDEIFELLVRTSNGIAKKISVNNDLTWRPATDAYETEDEFVVQVELAGMDPAGIDVHIDNGELFIRGVRNHIAPPGKKHYLKMEISVGPFLRRIAVPDGLDTASATAQYRSGFLVIRFARGDDGKRAKQRIDIGENRK
jgi:HSP20 family protein